MYQPSRNLITSSLAAAIGIVAFVVLVLLRLGYLPISSHPDDQIIYTPWFFLILVGVAVLIAVTGRGVLKRFAEGRALRIGREYRTTFEARPGKSIVFDKVSLRKTEGVNIWFINLDNDTQPLGDVFLCDSTESRSAVCDRKRVEVQPRVWRIHWEPSHRRPMPHQLSVVLVPPQSGDYSLSFQLSASYSGQHRIKATWHRVSLWKSRYATKKERE